MRLGNPRPFTLAGIAAARGLQFLRLASGSAELVSPWPYSSWYLAFLCSDGVAHRQHLFLAALRTPSTCCCMSSALWIFLHFISILGFVLVTLPAFKDFLDSVTVVLFSLDNDDIFSAAFPEETTCPCSQKLVSPPIWCCEVVSTSTSKDLPRLERPPLKGRQLPPSDQANNGLHLQQPTLEVHAMPTATEKHCHPLLDMQPAMAVCHGSVLCSWCEAGQPTSTAGEAISLHAAMGQLSLWTVWTSPTAAKRPIATAADTVASTETEVPSRTWKKGTRTPWRRWSSAAAAAVSMCSAVPAVPTIPTAWATFATSDSTTASLDGTSSHGSCFNDDAYGFHASACSGPSSARFASHADAGTNFAYDATGPCFQGALVLPEQAKDRSSPGCSTEGPKHQSQRESQRFQGPPGCREAVGCSQGILRRSPLG